MFNLRRLQKNITIKFGVPMLFLIIGGSFGLREFAQIRYDAQARARKMNPELEAKLKIKKNPNILEEEYEKMKVNTDEWRNIRGPRPGEDSREYQNQERSRMNKKD